MKELIKTLLHEHLLIELSDRTINDPQPLSNSDNRFNASGGNKIVDGSGNPLTLYHGTDSDFGEFDPNMKGTNTGFNNTVHGFFFTDKKENTSQFGDKVMMVNVFMNKPIDLRIKNIFNNEDQAGIIWYILSGQKVSNKKALLMLEKNIGLGEITDLYEELNTDKAHNILIKNGYDGILADLGNDETEYVVFNSNQIKVLNGNNSINEQEMLYNHLRNIIIEHKDFENVSKPKALIDKCIKADCMKSLDGVSLGKDNKSGKFFVYTHRARSKSYDKPEDITIKEIKFIETTG